MSHSRSVRRETVRGALISEYLDSYSEEAEPVDSAQIAEIVPFLNGQVGGPRSISQSDAIALTSASRDPERFNRPIQLNSSVSSSLTSALPLPPPVPLQATGPAGAPRPTLSTPVSRVAGAA